ncbi:MAG: hypothetical protein ACRCYE_09455 [Sarcina sp.]
MPYEFYIIICITLIILGIICFVKNIKEGVLAAIGGNIALGVIFVVHYIYYITNNFFNKNGLTIKDVISYIVCIAVTIIKILLIIFLVKFLGIKKR